MFNLIIYAWTELNENENLHKAIAAGLGVKVGAVIRVSGNRRSYDSGYYILRESSSYQAERPGNVIPPDKIKVTAEVEAVLELMDNYPDK